MPSERNGLFRFFDHFFKKDTAEEAVKSNAEPEVEMKSCREEQEAIQHQQEVDDETVMDLQRKDTERHRAVSNSLDGLQRKMRCHLLKMKKRNGGLDAAEEAELGGF